MSDEDERGRKRREQYEKVYRETSEAFWVQLRRQQFLDVVDLLKQLSTPRHVGRVFWESERPLAPGIDSSHLLRVKDCLGQLALKIKVEAWP